MIGSQDSFETSRVVSRDQCPSAIIYTHSMIEGSMTFIKSHSEALSRYLPVYAGAHRVNGLPLPDDRTYILNEGSRLGAIREAMFRGIGLAPGFVRKLRARRPKVVHAHFGTCGPAGLSLADALDVPLVVTFHGKDATTNEADAARTHRGREMLRGKNRMIARAGTFIAVSSYIRQRLLEQGYPESKVVLHRNGIDLDYFKPRGMPAREAVILFVGRFVEKKGIAYLIQAAAKLRETGSEFKLVVIGNGPLEPELRDAAAKAQIPCTFTGFLNVDEVKEWMERAAVVAVPSVTAADGDSEGLPTTLLEAQAMETPVVATRHSGMPEGLKEGVTAELVDERDVDGLTDKLRSFLESTNKAREFGRAGRRFVTDKFNIKVQVDGLEHIYTDLWYQRHANKQP